MTAVDSSRPALEVAEQNKQLNRYAHTCGEIECAVEANAFDLLKDYSTAGQQYDSIVLDPPAFAKTKRVLDTAIRGYKELNLRALKMPSRRRAGYLSPALSTWERASFSEMLGSAAADAGRRLRIMEKRGAALDHPVLSGVPETSSLKCVICQLLNKIGLYEFIMQGRCLYFMLDKNTLRFYDSFTLTSASKLASGQNDHHIPYPFWRLKIMTVLTRWEPFRELNTLQSRLNRLFEEQVGGGREESLTAGAFVPPVDIYEDEHSIQLKLEVPGIEEKDLDVKVENNVSDRER